ncbi:hypothetical protein ACOAKC_08495 [Hathewaya histolytica]|uniref:hypothetical protein n=1 Tax=Hathewaya histolytica TaxID=1498 RepID=UPI003B67E592
MGKQIKGLVVINAVFYFFIFLHGIVIKTYGDDYILQAIFYISLSFSTLVLEQSYRMGINKLKSISLLDFTLRIIVLILHFIWIALKWNTFMGNLITCILFVLNLIIELIMLTRFKNFPKQDLERIKNKDIREFIDKFYLNKIDISKFDLKLIRDLKDTMYLLELSGKGNLIAIFLFVLIFISEIIYKYFNRFTFFTIIVVIISIFLFVKLNTDLIKIGFKDEKNIDKKIIIENMSFIIGYIILFVCEVILKEKLSYMRVSVWLVGGLTFLPVLNRKYRIKEKLKIIYKKCN